MSKEENARKYESMMAHLYEEMEVDPNVLMDRHLDSLCKSDNDTLLMYYDVIYLELLKRGYKFK